MGTAFKRDKPKKRNIVQGNLPKFDQAHEFSCIFLIGIRGFEHSSAFFYPTLFEGSVDQRFDGLSDGGG
jgi:hypothetical protein